MPVPGPPPSDDRVRRAAPITWRLAHCAGCRLDAGQVARPACRCHRGTATAWRTWGAAWFASFWQPSDLPALRVIASLYDRVERGEFVRSAELRMWSDSFGITPRGRQSLRWKPPAEGGHARRRPLHRTAVPHASGTGTSPSPLTPRETHRERGTACRVRGHARRACGTAAPRSAAMRWLREVERVQPCATQPGAIRLALADLDEPACRLCAAVASGRATGATDHLQRGGGWPHTGDRRDEGVSEMLTAPEAARRFGVSAAYVRRKAADWGGELIEGQWRIPSHRIRTRRTDG
jgi:hypothetical protein